ncbi:MAG: hypothetical protein ACJ8DI_01165 [Ktedonobacteraceae bacterium]
MDFSQALAIWVIWTETNSIREHGAAPEEVFVPFNLPPVKPQATAEAQPPVAASSSDVMPIGV